MMFTTKDRDNDGHDTKNCAETKQGGWWYKNCVKSNLNGLYLPENKTNLKGIRWFYWKDDNRSMKRTEMKMRPVL